MNEKIDVDPLWKVIKDRSLMAVWEETAPKNNEMEGYEQANEMAEKALKVYIELISSSRNDGTPNYQHRAIYTALGLNSKATRVFAWRKSREVMRC